MPESPSQTPQPDRSPDERAADHRAVEALAADLLPALIGKLQATGLAELEVREGGWKVRLRRPLEVVGTGRRTTDRQVRLPAAGTQAGSHGGGAAPRDATPRAAAPRADDPADAPNATSPAVGIFRPLPGIVGRRVRAGDRLGSVDVLGVAQELVAPADGLVGPLLAEAGDGVEYGQPLIEMRPLPADRPADASTLGGAAAPASVAAPPAVGAAAVAGERR